MFTLIVSGNYEEDVGIFPFFSLFASQFHSVLVWRAQPNATPTEASRHHNQAKSATSLKSSWLLCWLCLPHHPTRPHLTVSQTVQICSVLSEQESLEGACMQKSSRSLWGTFPSASLVYNHDIHHQTLAWQSRFGSMQYDEIDKNCSVAWNWNPTNR